MQRLLRMAVLLPLFVLLPVLAVAQEAKKDAPPIDESKIRTQALSSGYVQGKLTAYDLETRMFTVQFAHLTKKLNPAVQQELTKLTAEYRQALAAKDKGRAAKIYEAGVAANGRLYDITEIPITFEFCGDKNMVYRTLEVPLGDDGKPKKLTTAEQKELGIDGKSPGVLFDPKKLDVELVVRMYIDKSKPLPDTTKKADPGKDLKKPDPPKETPKTETKPEEKKPLVKVVTSTKKPEEKKPEEKKPEEKKPEEPKVEKVLYPTNMIVIVPPMDGGAGGAGTNPFIKK